MQATAEAKTVAETAAASIHKDKSKSCTMVLSGVQGVNSVINGLYLPTQETGQDGRVLYRKSGKGGNEAMCIEHDDDNWWVIDRLGASRAQVEGGCALEDCRSRIWKVSDGDDFVDQLSVQMVTGEEAKSQASGRSALSPRRPSYRVFDADELRRPRPPLKQLPLSSINRACRW